MEVGLLGVVSHKLSFCTFWCASCRLLSLGAFARRLFRTPHQNHCTSPEPLRLLHIPAALPHPTKQVGAAACRAAVQLNTCISVEPQNIGEWRANSLTNFLMTPRWTRAPGRTQIACLLLTHQFTPKS